MSRGNEIAVAAVVLTAALVLTVVTASHREHEALPLAATALRAAVVEAAALDSCFQGVQDELFESTSGAVSVRSTDAAATRLATCDIEPLRARLADVRLAPRAPIGDATTASAHDDLAAADAALRRLVLDATATQLAMADELRRDRRGDLVAVGYRATAAAYRTASTHVDRAFARLEQSAAGPLPAGK